jgi:hypothetical protein
MQRGNIKKNKVCELAKEEHVKNTYTHSFLVPVSIPFLLLDSVPDVDCV